MTESLRAALDALPMPNFQHDMGAERFKVVKGSFWWHIRIGDGTANVGKFHSELAAQDVALKLLTAFRDGGFQCHGEAKTAIRTAHRDGARVALERAISICDAWQATASSRFSALYMYGASAETSHALASDLRALLKELS